MCEIKKKDYLIELPIPAIITEIKITAISQVHT
jgi:hypothetical protein